MARNEAEKRFIRHGGLLLEKLIGSWNGKCSPIRNFSAKELQQATNNYDSANVSGGDWYYSWYKGSIEGRIVSIKKFYRHQDAINDIVTAAQMNVHNNILKLIGCCLETDAPMAVYEFAETGTLSSHIHINGGETPPPSRSQPQPLLWKSRLRIATEVASAVAYLHIASRRPVVHRDINSSNIFLDRHNVAKLSGFEFSIEIPDGETHVEAIFAATVGYVAPEYYETSFVSEKVDVYGFGMLLLEILSGQKPLCDGVLLMELLTRRKPIVDCSDIITYFRTHVLVSNKDNEVLDPTILEEVRQNDYVQQQVQEVSELALKCTETDAEERPTMLDVARQLLQLKRKEL